MIHTNYVKNLDPHVRTRMWQVGPIMGVVLLRLLRNLSNLGNLRILGEEVLLIAGWILGQVLTELDHVFYAMVCNPQELTCQRVKKETESKNWRNAWRILQETKHEREKLPIRNMLTVAVILGMGIWVISSNANFLAMGVILGMTYRLLADLLSEQNWKKWYWLFAREFNEVEHRGLVIAWVVVLAWETIKVILI